MTSKRPRKKPNSGTPYTFKSKKCYYPNSVSLGRNSEGEFPQLLDISDFCPQIQAFFKGNFKWDNARELFSEIMSQTDLSRKKAKLYFLMFDDAFKKSAKKGQKMKAFLEFLSFLVYIGKGGKYRPLQHIKPTMKHNVSSSNTFVPNTNSKIYFIRTQRKSW